MEEVQATENSSISSAVVDQNHDSSVSGISNHGSNSIEPENEISEEEIRGILEIIAATGKFWHEWGKLKGMMSFYLNQILARYPEAKWTSEQQISALGETFLELVKRLDDALCSFIDGPPFTLQRLCEILLTATSIYPNLSKLALALEKNLSVTSMLTISTEAHSSISEPSGSATAELEKEDSSILQNGVQEHLGGDASADEIMNEVEETEVDEVMTMDMETFEEIVRSSDTNSTDNGDSKPATDI